MCALYKPLKFDVHAPPQSVHKTLSEIIHVVLNNGIIIIFSHWFYHMCHY